ncbi:MAG: Coenzyme F420 hydrogenase/dehydrogenase, beta subunit C-terminal domain [Thermoleophilia bacterium]
MAELERRAIGRERNEDNELGAYRTALAAHAADPHVRSAGTSGGVVTSLLVGLLEAGAITGAVVTAFEAERPYRPVPTIVRDVASIKKAAQSKYALTPQVAALRDARHDDRLAFVGLPCQVAGLRKAELAGRGLPTVSVIIGLFCLSNFYREATTYIIEHVLGLPLDVVADVAYRDGPFPGAFTVTTNAGSRHHLPYPEARAYFRMYRPYRCITCSDWSAELADISVGDLFGDPSREAYSSVLVRTERGERALAAMVEAGDILVEDGDPDAISRNPGFYYKKRGNASFIADARAHGLPTPTYPQPAQAPEE